MLASHCAVDCFHDNLSPLTAAAICSNAAFVPGNGGPSLNSERRSTETLKPTLGLEAYL